MYVCMYVCWGEGGKAQPPLSGIGLLARVPGSDTDQLVRVSVCQSVCHAQVGHELGKSEIHLNPAKYRIVNIV